MSAEVYVKALEAHNQFLEDTEQPWGTCLAIRLPELPAGCFPNGDSILDAIKELFRGGVSAGGSYSVRSVGDQ